MTAPENRELRLKLLRLMLEIRIFEEKIVSVYPAQDMKTPVHLYIGQEAIAAGVCANLCAEDYVFSTHRNHGHYLAKGANLNAIVAELYGKTGGCSKGKGGSMHLVDTDAGCMGTSAIVGGSLALGTGAALAIKMRGENRLSAIFFGDGAADEGTFQESLNFAALKKLPALFVCENNFYATNSPQSARHSVPEIYRRAEAFGIASAHPGGNDADAVYEAAADAAAHIRAGKGPYFLQCDTYRWKGHVGPDCDFEKGCRPRAELDKWLERCPVKTYQARLLKSGGITGQELAQMRARIAAKVEAAWEFAKKSPSPGPRELLTDVYK